jgi:hypothetical protein
MQNGLYDTGASPSGKAAGFDPAMRWFESSRPCHQPPVSTEQHHTGASPSGKAAGFDPAMRWFESSRPCHIPQKLFRDLPRQRLGTAFGL